MNTARVAWVFLLVVGTLLASIHPPLQRHVRAEADAHRPLLAKQAHAQINALKAGTPLAQLRPLRNPWLE